MDSKQPVLIPFQWKKLWGFLPLAFFAYVLVRVGGGILCTENVLDVKWIIAIIAMVMYILLSLNYIKDIVFQYLLTEEGIHVLFLGLIVRKISWQSVAQAQYIHYLGRHSFRWGNQPMRDHLIYVTLHGCPRYRPIVENRIRHSLRHPLGAITIWLPGNDVLYYFEKFQSFYPNLESQDPSL